jgi:hypothetical protein
VGDKERSSAGDPEYTPSDAAVLLDAATSTSASDASDAREPTAAIDGVADAASTSDAQVATNEPLVPVSDAHVAEVDAGMTAPMPVQDAHVEAPDAADARDAAADDAAARDAAADDAAARDAAARDAAVNDAAPPPPPPPTCASPQIACGSSCIDTRSDVSHCGACGDRCPSGESCVESRCWPAPPAGCGFRTFEGRAYLFCNEGRSWRDARQSCIGARMDLTIIADAAENTFARSIGFPSWTGASDLASEGRFTAVVPGNLERADGAAVTYTNWRTSEPTNTFRCTGRQVGSLCLDGDWIDEDCVLLYAEGDWNDDDCRAPQRYVCEAY